MSQMCPNCSHDNPGEHPGGSCSHCTTTLRGLLGQGQRIKTYEVQGVMGCGGFGAVYRAVDLKNNRKVAVKEQFALDNEDAARFEHEATILSQLAFAQLPSVYEHFEHAGKRYLVMEFIEGQSLATIVAHKLQRGEKIREAIVLGWGLQLCEAVAYLHKEGIVHRDIKPDNIRLNANGEIFLVDFGVAKKIVRGPSPKTVPHGLTPGYSPIEQYASSNSPYRGAEIRSDIYSVGATLYTIATGIVPPDARARKAKTDLLRPIQALHPQFSDRFASAIERALELEPEDRFETVAQLRSALQAHGDLAPPKDEEVVAPQEERSVAITSTTLEELWKSLSIVGPSFVFSDGREAWDLGEFVALCDELWEDAKIHLYERHIEQWAWLPIHGKSGLIIKARQIREHEPNRDAGLEAWLQMAASIAKVQRSPRCIREVPTSVVSSSTPPANQSDELPPPSAATLTVSPQVLDFGRADATHHPTLNLKIHYKGASPWRGSIIPQVPWLEIGSFDEAQAHDTALDIPVSLRAEGLSSPGTYYEERALALTGETQIVHIPAQVVAVEPILQLFNTVVDFGEIAATETLKRTVELYNPSLFSWRGTARSTVPWLEATPGEIVCNPGTRTSIEVSLVHLPPYRNGAAIKQMGRLLLDGMGQQVSLTVHAVLSPSQNDFQIDPPTVDFGQVSNLSSVQPQRVELYNPSNEDLHLFINPILSWLTVEPRSLECRRGGRAEVVISLSKLASGLVGPARFDRPNAIEITGTEIHRYINVKIEIVGGQ